MPSYRGCCAKGADGVFTDPYSSSKDEPKRWKKWNNIKRDRAERRRGKVYKRDYIREHEHLEEAQEKP